MAAVALGVFADQGQRLPGFWAVVPELGTPWALLGFGAGRFWRHRRQIAVLAGLSCVVLALWAYYLYVHLQYGTELYNVMNGSRGSYLIVLAAAVGGASGFAGALSGAANAFARTAGWAFVVAVPAAEVWRASQYDDARHGLQALLTGTALCLLAWAWRYTGRWWALVVATFAWVGLGLLVLVGLQAFPI